MSKIHWHIEKEPYVWGGGREVEEILSQLSDMERLALAKLLCREPSHITVAGKTMYIGSNTDDSFKIVSEESFAKKFDRQVGKVLRDIDLKKRKCHA